MLLKLTLMGFLAGVIGTGTGGLFGYMFKHPTRLVMDIAFAVSGGLMLSIVCFDLLPTSFENGGVPLMLAVVFLSTIIIMAFENLLDKKESSKNASSYTKMGIIVMLSVALHNFPEGLAIGSSGSIGYKNGLFMALLIGIHNIPEGLAIAASLKAAGKSNLKILISTALCGVPMGLGALVGALAGSISRVFIGVCIASAGGCMLYIVLSELLPSVASSKNKIICSLTLTLSFIFGIILSKLL